MKKKLLGRIRSQTGESIAEVLIALLISALALVMLASMISSTQSMVDKSKNKMKEYDSQNEILESGGYSKGPETVTIQGTNINVSPAPQVNYEMNEKLGTNVYAYAENKG